MPDCPPGEHYCETEGKCVPNENVNTIPCEECGAVHPAGTAHIIKPLLMIKHSFTWANPIMVEDPEQYQLVKGVAIIEGVAKRGEVLDKENIIYGAGAMAAFAMAGQLVIDIDHFDPLPKEYAVKYPGLQSPYPVGYVYDADAEETEVNVEGGKKEKRYAVEFLATITNKTAYQMVKENKFSGCSAVEYFRKEMCACEAGKCQCPREGSKFLRLTFTLEGEPNSYGTWVGPVTKEDIGKIITMPEVAANAIKAYSTPKPKSIEEMVKKHDAEITEIKKVVHAIKRRVVFVEHVNPISEAIASHKNMQKLTKIDANYRPANGTNPCAECRWFGAWEDREPGYCALVEGDINHGDTCDRFELPPAIAPASQQAPAPPKTPPAIKVNTTAGEGSADPAAAPAQPPPKPNALIVAKPVNPSKEQRKHNFTEFLDSLPKAEDIPNHVSGEEVKRLLNTVRTELSEGEEEDGKEENGQ